MKPVEFKEQNIVFRKPGNVTDEECGSLPAFRGGGQIISCWKAETFWERIRFLLFGKCYISVYSSMQPPIYIGVKTPFEKQKSK